VDEACPADDMYSIGVLVTQALTREIPVVHEDSGPYILREASEPLIGIVRHCLDPDPARRWTSAQALAHLSRPETALPSGPASHAGVKARVEARVEASVKSLPETSRDRLMDRPNDGRATVNLKWIYAAVAALLLIVAILALTKRNASRATPGRQTVQAPASPASIHPRSPSPPVPPPVPDSQTKTQNRKASGWVTIVASYGPRTAAEKRVLALSKRWHKFQWEVFQPPSQSLNFVVIGKNLSEDKAEALRQRALQAGISKDVYIERFE
jgi:serine/threonine protein kinase